MKKGLHIGTSGWSYDKDWRGTFYASSGPMLKQYLSYFETAEINSTFYALPQPNFVKHLTTLDQKVFFTANSRKNSHMTIVSNSQETVFQHSPSSLDYLNHFKDGFPFS